MLLVRIVVLLVTVMLVVQLLALLLSFMLRLLLVNEIGAFGLREPVDSSTGEPGEELFRKSVVDFFAFWG